METIIVLFILALSEKDPKLKETLKSVLAFYKENRELIKTLSTPSNPSSAQQQVPPPPPEEPAQQSEPASEDSVRILEEFLKHRL